MYGEIIMKIIIEEAQYQCQYCKKIYNNIEEAIKCQKDCFKKTDKYEIRKLKQDLYLQDNINDFIKILKNIDLLKNNKQKNF